MPKRGDWVVCGSCGEETIWIWHEITDFVCSVCGGFYPRLCFDYLNKLHDN